MKEYYPDGNVFNYRELEQYLYNHPAVLDVAVVPGPGVGEEVAAFIVPRPGVFDPRRLEAFFSRKLKSLKIGGFVEYRENLPRSGTGKLYRRELMEQAGLRQGS